jgi:hypothetical protein
MDETTTERKNERGYKKRLFQFEWNDIIMKELFEAEEKKGTDLNPDEILQIGKSLMSKYEIPVKWERYIAKIKMGQCSQEEKKKKP